MKKLLLIICLIGAVLLPIQNKVYNTNQTKTEPITVKLDFEDDDVPEFIFF